jgi:ABC-type multidrug transport system permease subunit
MKKNTQTEYTGELKDIRKKRMFLWFVFASYIPAIVLAFTVGSGQATAIVIAIIWLIGAGVGGVMVSFSRCPRCNQLFHMRGISTSWGRRCRHCNLKL